MRSVIPLVAASLSCLFLFCVRGRPAVGVAYFERDVVPVFTKLGCNTAQCHGGAGGQGNFRLSLFGADPALDYESLARVAGGRRVSRSEPETSLVVEKALDRVAHRGGRRLESGQREHEVLLAWIKQGALWAGAAEPKLVSVQVAPKERILALGDRERIRATAEFSDGKRRDVTEEVSYTSSDSRVVAVDGTGKVQALGFGEALVLASYQRVSDVARIVVPRPLAQPFPKVAALNKIDELVHAKLRKLGLPPSEICTDEVFLRRLYLDLIGTLPTPDEVRAFLRDRNPRKRSVLIDRLMAREEFADHWALKWGDLLRIKSEFPVRVWPKGTQAYYRWVRQSLVENKPYDRFVREMLLATGSNFRHGAVNFFRANASKDPQTIAETTALLFMGVRLGCARCHGHPTESWGLEDNLGLAAFFGKVAFKATQEWKEEIVYVNRKGALRHPRTKEAVKPKLLGGEVLELAPEQDPRGKLADWLTSPKNPYFARSIANRVWSWFLGRGIVHEPDDLRPSNPPSNPELLAFLTAEVVRSRFDLRHLFRLILSSGTYQRSSKANEWNLDDDRHFSRYYLRRLSAEQLLDAIGAVTETSERYSSPIPEPYTNLPPGHRAVQLYDGDLSTPFLELFGRAARDTPYECERNLATSMRQELHLINSEHVQSRIAGSPRVRRWLQAKKSDAEIVDELYLLALSRLPKPEEKKKGLEYLGRDPRERAQAVEDLVWAVLNSTEFLFNH